MQLFNFYLNLCNTCQTEKNIVVKPLVFDVKTHFFIYKQNISSPTALNIV